jgi:hypothetical protein
MSIIISSAIIAVPLMGNYNAYAVKEKPHLLSPYINKPLSAKWWQWVLPIPPSTNPLIDANPCNVNQKGYFFFLAGTLDGSAVERTCTIPKGKAIFFPVYNFFQTIEANNPNLDTIPEIKQAVINNVNQATNLKASVDGVDIKVDNKLRALSNVFRFTLGEDNIFGPEFAGTYISVSDGYWVPLKPLKAGNHEISFSADGPDGFRIDVTYHIKVQ